MLALAEFVEYAPLCEAVFTVSYPQYAVCRKFLESMDFSFTGEDFSGDVTIRGRLRRDDRERLETFLRDLCGGAFPPPSANCEFSPVFPSDQISYSLYGQRQGGPGETSSLPRCGAATADQSVTEP